tara:strand:+ start:369 stop:518 length:150 start_codon:yes stop_codon:yes gene_type:complete
MMINLTRRFARLVLKLICLSLRTGKLMIEKQQLIGWSLDLVMESKNEPS